MSAPALRKSSATGSMVGPSPPASGRRATGAGSSGGVKLPQIKNAADARELEEEAAAKAAARKPKAALTPAEKRAAKLRQEQAREEAAAAKKLKDLKLAEVKAARRMSATSQPGTGRHSMDGSLPGSALPSGRGSAMGMRPATTDGAGSDAAEGGHGGGHDDGVDFIENPDGSFSAVPRAHPELSQAEQDDADEAAALAAAEAEKKPEENYDIIFDGPKSPLIMATAARHVHEVMRLIQEVPIEYRVEFVNAYDDHGCSAIFFAIGPEHQDCMQLLLDYGADPNLQNNKKNGPLHIACAIQNKKAAKILIEHGANIMLENWQYQKPHEMVTERDKVSSTQAYLNLVAETFAEKVANKEVFANVPRHQRSYYRSIYDIADWKELGVLRYDTVEPLLDAPGADGSVVRPDAKWIFGFFSGWDMDKNGVISFPEFLHRIVAVLNEKERIKKKLKRRQMLAAKRKKKREAEAAKKAGSAANPASVMQEAAGME